MRMILSNCCRGTWRSWVGAFVLVWPCLSGTAENKCFLPEICGGISNTKKDAVFKKLIWEYLNSPRKGFGVDASLHLLIGAWNWYLCTDFWLFFSPSEGAEHCLHVLYALKFNNCPWITAFMSFKDLINAIKSWQPVCLQTNLLYSVLGSLKSDLSTFSFIKWELYGLWIQIVIN